MALRSGLAAQVGFVQEVTYGVPVTVTRFYPLVSESIQQTIDRIESDSIISGRQVLDSAQWAPGRIGVKGDLGFELYDRSAGLLWKNMLGGAAISGAGPYTQTYTPGDLYGLSMCWQIGVPGTSGTVQPFTYPGAKIASWELACKEGENATLGVTLLGKTEYRSRSVVDGVTTNTSTTVTSATALFSQSDVGSPITGTGIVAATTIASVQSATSATLSQAANATGSGITFTIGVALASASYASGLVPFRYTGGTLTLGGSAVKVSEAKVSGDNKLDERRFLGQAQTDEPIGADLREYKGEVTAEFTDLTLYNRFVNGVESALVLAFAAGSNTLTITCNVRYDGASPDVDGRGIVKQKLPFVCVGTTDAAAITVVTVNSDAAA